MPCAHACRDAWNKRRGTSQLEAERLYVEALIRVRRALANSPSRYRPRKLIGLYCDGDVIQILRSFSSRTQAVELLHELEDFDLDPPLRGDTGAFRLYEMPRWHPTFTWCDTFFIQLAGAHDDSPRRLHSSPSLRLFRLVDLCLYLDRVLRRTRPSCDAPSSPVAALNALCRPLLPVSPSSPSAFRLGCRPTLARIRSASHACRRRAQCTSRVAAATAPAAERAVVLVRLVVLFVALRG